MSSGPVNFLNRINGELKKLDLPPFDIINPNPAQLDKLEKKDVLHIGRLNGAIYYKTTSVNLFNLIKQRRESISFLFQFLKYLPENSSMFLNKHLNDYLNRASLKLHKESDIIVFQSEFSKKLQTRFVSDFCLEKPNRVILNGIPREIFSPVKEKIALDGFPRLVVTASFRLHKRLQDAINITNELSKTCPDVRLHVIGDMDRFTKEHIKELNMQYVVFHGKVNTDDLPLIYSNCHVGLSLCIFDACPNSVIEMMGCGLPVITNSQSGAVELVKNIKLIVEDEFALDYMEIQTAAKIPEVDIPSWVDAVNEVLDNQVYFKEQMLVRVEEELDIKIAAKKYAEFIMENYHAK